MRQLADPEFWLREHGPKLLALARQWVDCRAEAEDVFQEAFVRFWQTRDTVRQPLLYLYRCVRNAAVDRSRSAKLRERHEQAADTRAGPPLPEARLQARERDRKIGDALAKLPRNQREVVALRVWSDLTFDQIGKILSIPRSTAHVWYGTAMQGLQRELQEEMQP
jgi:RNA polymerase sigma-70 factor (ECF subfamily)